MRIIFKKSPDGVNTIRKNFTDSKELDVQLLKDFDIINPVLYIRDAGIENFNYFEIPDLNRSYYVLGFENLGGNRFRIMGAVDVCTTYENEILDSDGLFYRKIKSGDYINSSVDYSVLTDVVNYESNVEVDIENKPIILTTIGSKGID